MSLEICYNATPGTGWHYFLSALAESFARQGLDRRLGKTALNAIHGRPRRGYFNVLVVDGVYYDTPRLHWNNPIREAILSHDLVIYQSRASQILAEQLLGVKARRDAVIHNGTSLAPYRRPPPREPLIVSCANWRPNKRPLAIASAFALAVNRHGLRARLVMAGHLPAEWRLAHPAIEYPGNLSRLRLRRLLAQARLMVHICHIDSCPLAVVEGLRMGVPVVCNNIGGTPELAGASGTIVPLDREFDGRPVASIESVGDASVDTSLLGRAIFSAFAAAQPVSREDLAIDARARSYLAAIVSARR